MSDLEDSTVTYTEALPSPDYVPGSEYLPSPVYVPYVSEPVYPEFMPLEDDVLPAEEQPLPAVVLPTADSPGYITKSEPEKDSKENDEDPEEDPADYPDHRDDGEDEEEESYRDDADDEEEDEDDDEEEEHPALADSVPPPVHRYRAAMIRLRVESPSTSYLLPLPSPIVLPHTRESVAMMRAIAPSTYIFASRSETPPSGTPPLLPIPLPTPSPPLLLPLLTIEQYFPHPVDESSSAPTTRPTGGFRSDYRFVGTLDDEIRRDPKREDTNEIYGRLDDAQDDRSLMSGQLNMLRRDRHAHARTARLMETKAKLSHEA
ncbi:hypothetical protein Tco_1070398 [Tanacetum coccineum]|uniref:Uncharacterized protein n=1 Tax=Tanacetum coccineum TaxID=301880 RepID=A0ABQ5HLB8_9ASTR